MDVVVAGAETADLQSQLFQRRSHTDNSTNQRRYSSNFVLFEIFNRVKNNFDSLFFLQEYVERSTFGGTSVHVHVV